MGVLNERRKPMEKKKEVVKQKNALEVLATRLKVEPTRLKTTLKATVCKGRKTKEGTYAPLTDEEFVAFAVVANTYKLNPFTKEIYAYPDTKGAGIIPIISVDGWNKLMTTHHNYKTHKYVYAEEIKTPEGGKPCPEWVECHIEKQDGSSVIVREYLDECYRKLTYASPWQTHTKRMLRHKAKIQAAREAFGFGGIYDQDEGERIIEAETEKNFGGKPETEEPKELPQNGAESPYKAMLERFGQAKEIIGQDQYYKVLHKHGFEKANQIRDVALGNSIVSEMSSIADQMVENG